MTQRAALEIVWRNPKPPERWQRWEQINQDSAGIRYLVQEFVSTSLGSFWMTTSSLEFVSGGRACFQTWSAVSTPSTSSTPFFSF